MKWATLVPVNSLVFILFSSMVAHAADEAPAPDTPEAVQAVLSDYVAAFNRQDVAALGAKWREQGVFINQQSGERLVGREAIEGSFQTLFDDRKDLTLGGRVDEVRFIRPDVAHVAGRAITVGSDDEPLESTFSAILVRDGEQWLFDSIQETRAAAAESPSEPLEALNFLVGRWVDDVDAARIVTTVRWGLNRAFLVRAYRIERGDDQVDQGTQVIGWDPRQERIRCWMFNSDGSLGEGTWSPSEDGWTVKIRQTLADGRIAGATQVITRIDEDTLSVQLIGHEVDGRSFPSSPPVRVVRVNEQADNQAEN